MLKEAHKQIAKFTIQDLEIKYKTLKEMHEEETLKETTKKKG